MSSPHVHTDAELVHQAVAGDRDAFGKIVARYQSLICSLSYSQTGNVTQSEDLAQETFLAAWRQLPSLREQGKLRSWLCGIARNLINNGVRRRRREPTGYAETLENSPELLSPEPLPSEEAASEDERALLWRSLERIPLLYREPLVLFYREHQSVERVARALELSEETVRQRLVRGRQLIQAEVTLLVESALARTAPGKAFTRGVMAALPATTLLTKVATTSAVLAKSQAIGKGAALTKGALMAGLSGALLGPFIGLLNGYLGYRTSLVMARSPAERVIVKESARGVVLITALLLAVVGGLVLWAQAQTSPLTGVFGAVVAIICLIFGALYSWWGFRIRRRLLEMGAHENRPAATGAWEYRSKLSLLGLPIVHLRMSRSNTGWNTPVKAWIAGGDVAYGVLLAWGGVAIAPVAVGGLALGGISLGGVALGALALGGMAFGGAALGGLAIGGLAMGGVAIGIKGALGGFAAAYTYAQGGIAHGEHAGDAVAAAFFAKNAFFRGSFRLAHYGTVLIWISLLSPFVSAWLLFRAKNQAKKPS